MLIEIESCFDCPRFERRKVFSSGRFPFIDPDGKPVFLGWKYICGRLQRTIDPDEGVEPPPLWCPLRKQLPESVRKVAAYLVSQTGPYPLGKISTEYDVDGWSRKLGLSREEIRRVIDWFRREGWTKVWYSILDHKTFISFRSKEGYETVKKFAEEASNPKEVLDGGAHQSP